MMPRLLYCFVLPAALWAATPGLRESGFEAGPEGRPAGWSTWSARAETAPRCFVDAMHSRGRGGSLAISGNSNPAGHGGWQRKVEGIAAGAWYRFTAWYRTEAVAADSLQVVARLDWREVNDKRAGQPDYVYRARREGEWTRLTTEAQAPDKAGAVLLQLYLSNSPQGTVWWDDVSFDTIPAPAARRVTVATVDFKPKGGASAADNVERFIGVVEREAPAKTDLILLPEGITVVGTGKTYAAVAEAVPGPSTERLGRVARERGTYVAAGLYEREGNAIYNTAVLIDRAGRLAGKYRKVYLPREEIEGGITPGNDYPVFRTDFGTVGMMICYDVFFADPARALASRGAEILLMPIWGGDRHLGKARAIENGVYLVASGYDYPNYIMDPAGEVLSLAERNGSVAVATIDLAKRFVDPWLGEMHARRMKELRVDIAPPKPGFE